MDKKLKKEIYKKRNRWHVIKSQRVKKIDKTEKKKKQESKEKETVNSSRVFFFLGSKHSLFWFLFTLKRKFFGERKHPDLPFIFLPPPSPF